jgi:hypothetical protein
MLDVRWLAEQTETGSCGSTEEDSRLPDDIATLVGDSEKGFHISVVTNGSVQRARLTGVLLGRAAIPSINQWLL